MPVSPYAISGKVYDTDNSTVVSGATVTAWNERTGKKLTTTDTSNDSGDYIIDLANFPDHDYENADAVTVQASKGNKIIQYRTTIDTDVGYEEKDLYLEYSDPLGLMIDMMDDNWDKSTTDGISPTVGRIFDYKELDMANNDYILVYSYDEGFAAFDISATSFHQQPFISLDIRTTFKTNPISLMRGHLSRMKDEVYRILKANIKDPGYTYRLLKPVRVRDMTDKRIGMGRIIIDIELNKWGA